MVNYLATARMLEDTLQGLAGRDIPNEWRVFLELAAKGLGINKAPVGQSRKRSKNTPPQNQSCRHLCSEHLKPLDLSSLGHDVQELVLARLPVNEILQLRGVSKYWREATNPRSDSMFFHACDEARPRMFGLLFKVPERTGPGNLFRLRIYDRKASSWQVFHYRCELPRVCRAASVKCADGGLVVIDLYPYRGRVGFPLHCPIEMRVMNPLTREICDLPAIPNVEHTVLHDIWVDRESKSYKVLLAVQVRGQPSEDVLVYDSGTKEWSQPKDAADVMYGDRSARDFVHGRLRSGADYFHQVRCAFSRNRLFKLVKSLDGPASDLGRTYSLHEYALTRERLPTWSLEVIHRCEPFERLPNSNFEFTLCCASGYLIVFAYIDDLAPWRVDKTWLYDLATRIWSVLPPLPGKILGDIPCELLWTAQP